MKKLLLACMLIASGTAFAQTKDMKITLVKPGVGDKIISGQPFDIEYIITNNGTVATTTTDSMIVLYILNSTTTINAAGQSPAFYTNRVMNANDTIWAKFKLTLNITGTSGPVSVPFCTKMFAQNGNVTIDPDQSNNNACNNVTLPVNEVTKALESLEVYPNPANDVLNISFDYKLASKIQVLDLNGKLMDQVFISGKETRLELNTYHNGIYLYQILDAEGALIKAGKFSVSK